MDKNLLFEYIVYRLDEWKNRIGSDKVPVFTKLRLQKILFLICAWNVSKSEPKLLSVFNRFYALPYGPVEMDIYKAMKDDSKFKHLRFDGNECVYKDFADSMFVDLADEMKNYVDDAIKHFKLEKRRYLTMPVFDLVDITHRWSAWYFSTIYANSQGRNMEKMSSESIINSTQYYG